MTARFHSRNGQRREPLSRLPSTPRFQSRAGIPVRRSDNWRALPVEGSKAWQQSRPGILSRIFTR